MAILEKASRLDLRSGTLWRDGQLDFGTWPGHPENFSKRTLPFGTRLRVCRSGRCVVVRINDRGPYVGQRVLDLSYAAAQLLGYDGVEQVTATPVALTTDQPAQTLPARRTVPAGPA